MTKADAPAGSNGEQGPVSNFLLGLKVLGSELVWLGLELLRKLEIAQLRKRLNKELEDLARLADTTAVSEDETIELEAKKDLTAKQIEFLKEEIGFLENEFEDKRKRYVATRLGRWNIS